MTHALADFEDVYRRCVERIDVNWLVELLDLVNWDDLGPRVWERAVVIASPHLREMCEVRVSRGLHSTDNSDPAAAGEAVRQNLSASHALHTQPWIQSWALQWFRWTQHQQNPDGLFTIRLATTKANTEWRRIQCNTVCRPKGRIGQKTAAEIMKPFV